jgi:hypothetical protein
VFVVGNKTGTPLKRDELKSENDVGNAAIEGGQTRRQAASPPPSDVFALFGSSSSSFESSNTAATPAPSSGGDLLRYVRTMIAGRKGEERYKPAGQCERKVTCDMGFGVWERVIMIRIFSVIPILIPPPFHYLSFLLAAKLF